MHPMVIEVRGAGSVMLLRMKMVRPMGWARDRRHSRVRLLELEGQLGLVRSLGVRCRAVLGRDRRHGRRLLKHLQIGFLLVSRWGIPCWKSLVGRGNASIESVILLRLLCTLLLHSFYGVKLVVKRWPLSNRPWLLRTEKGGWAGSTGDGSASEEWLRAGRSTRCTARGKRARGWVGLEFHSPDVELGGCS